MNFRVQSKLNTDSLGRLLFVFLDFFLLLFQYNPILCSLRLLLSLFLLFHHLFDPISHSDLRTLFNLLFLRSHFLCVAFQTGNLHSEHLNVAYLIHYLVLDLVYLILSGSELVLGLTQLGLQSLDADVISVLVFTQIRRVTVGTGLEGLGAGFVKVGYR